MKRRGEISMEVIIIAAIALLVLVILAVLIVRAGGGIGRGTSCESVAQGAQCTDSCEYLEGYAPSTHSCPEGQVCCIPILANDE